MVDARQFNDWVVTLNEFSSRNAGRRTVLEVDAPEYGAREEESDYPFWGATFDPRDGRVQIMLGEQGSVERHLTHTIDAVRDIAIQRNASGRDVALRVVHDSGQTLLRFLET